MSRHLPASGDPERLSVGPAAATPDFPAGERQRSHRLWGSLRRGAVRVDRQPEMLAVVRRVRRRLPGDERFGDPLSSAEESTVAYLARGVAALRPDRDSFTAELGLTGLQLWQSLSEAAGRGRGDSELALLYTDLVGFSSWALEVGDYAAVTLLQEVGAVIERAVFDHRGRIVKRLGDGAMATFLSAQDAVDAALEIQRSIEQVEIAGHRPRLRTGVHWGRPRRLGGEYLGVDLTVAAAVGDAARAGQVLVSGPALAQLDPAFHGLTVGRRRRLREPGLPADLQVATVRRGADG